MNLKVVSLYLVSLYLVSLYLVSFVKTTSASINVRLAIVIIWSVMHLDIFNFPFRPLRRINTAASGNEKAGWTNCISRQCQTRGLFPTIEQINWMKKREMCFSGQQGGKSGDISNLYGCDVTSLILCPTESIPQPVSWY